MNGKFSPRQHFYAVYVPNWRVQTDLSVEPSSSVKDSGNSLGIVCDTLQEAVGLVKKYEQDGARFKTFTNLEEAKAYILCGRTFTTPRVVKNKSSVIGSPYPDSSKAVSSPADEKPPPFGSISRADLNRFKKSIETCDNAYFEETTNENPRYLINCNNDSPTILFEGCRYNAMHIATKSNNLFACKLILELFTDVSYVGRLYPGDPPDVLDNRREFLLDRYLNTPDKGLNETPLHFAAKNGYLEIVRMLISLPTCRKDTKNKYGETPADLAQSRCAEVLTITPKLKLCLDNEAAYVPLYRSSDYKVPYFLAPPCVGFPSAMLSGEMPGVGAPSPINASAYLKALAGPMSMDKAKSLFKEWSTHKTAGADSTPIGVKTLLNATSRVKRTDLHKGMERLGRRLADEYNVDWSEYWEFLKVLCDIRNSDGLRLFENYLNTKLTNKRKLSFEELFTKVKAFSSISEDSEAVRSFTSSTPVRFHANDNSTPVCASKLLFKDEEAHSCTYGESEQQDAFFDSFECCDDFDHEVATDASMLYKNEVVDNDDVDDNNFATPPETPPTVYIHGDFATKNDFDVFVAVENVLIDKSLYPNVRRWYDRISGYSVEDREKWPALDSPRMKRSFRRVSKD